MLDKRLTPGYSRFYGTNGDTPGIQSNTLLSAVFLDLRDHLWPEISDIVVKAQFLKLFKLTINDFRNWLHELHFEMKLSNTELT